MERTWQRLWRMVGTRRELLALGALLGLPTDAGADSCGGITYHGTQGLCQSDADCNAACQCGPNGVGIFVKWRIPHHVHGKERRRRWLKRHQRRLVSDWLICEPIPEDAAPGRP